MNETPMNPEQNDPEHNDVELSASMRRIVPEDMITEGLVAGARSKRNRRRGVVGAFAALALVAVVVPVTLNLPNGDPTVAQPASTVAPSSPVDVRTISGVPGAEACYNDDGTPISRDQGGSGPAPTGAVRAWFCGDYSPETGQGFVGPREPLTTGVDALIEGVQSQEVIDLTVTTCLNDYNLSFNAVFEYEDGTRRVIGGDRHGCRATYDGGVARAGADDFYGALHSAWEAQRETWTGDEWVVPHLCPGPLSLLEMEPEDTVQASVCGQKEDGSRASAFVDEDLVDEIVGEFKAMRESSDEETPQPESSAPEQQVWLTLSNRYTDYLTFVRHEDGLYRAYDGEGLEWFWEPSEDLSARLDEALDAAGPTDGPPAGKPIDPTVNGGGEGPMDPVLQPDPPKPFVPEECSLSSSGELMADLPDGAIPEGAESVRLCPAGEFGMATPLEALVDVALVPEAVAAFNGLTPAPENQACTMELGPAYTAVYSYADGTRHAVELQEYGCGNVVGGGVVKAGSDGFKETLLSLWQEQRGYQPIVERPAPLCPLAGSIFTLVPGEAEFTSGVACVVPTDPTGPDAGAGNPAGESPMSDQLVKKISGQLGTPSPEMMDLVPTGDSLVLLTASGDPLVLQRLEDGSFTSFQDGEPFSWTPSGDVAAALDELFDR